MYQLLDLAKYPIDNLDSAEGKKLVADCQAKLASEGIFSLEGFVLPEALIECVAEMKPLIDEVSYAHKRKHNIYFKDKLENITEDHPALQKFETINHTVCADQMPSSLVCRLYEWQPFIDFLAAVMGKDVLYRMEDPLARANVMAYRHGEALNWHFDRSEFTTTVILQSPKEGGAFQYRNNLRTDNDPNYDGVANLLNGDDPDIQTLMIEAGTLNVFKGVYTAHRVTPVEGPTERIVSVYSYYEEPNVMFSDKERLGFYGRTA
ncbi:HalD/BesD family halogenase [Kiloniella sp.]|uniref:HalD/BesD family halogenase n=1 Tax=Kiloniella sp. TaxID=1938587 RepID=UPI003B022C76